MYFDPIDQPYEAKEFSSELVYQLDRSINRVKVFQGIFSKKPWFLEYRPKFDYKAEAELERLRILAE
jgi:hypothetical protein